MDKVMSIDVQMKHTWGSEGNWKELVLSFHHGSLTELGSPGLLGTALPGEPFSCTDL